MSNAPNSKLAALLQFLEADPNNLPLLSDAAEAALAEAKPDVARDLLGRYATQAELPDREANLAGLATLQCGDFAEAANVFSRLLQRNSGKPALQFNLAWCEAMLKNSGGALALLDDATTDALPQAAALHVQLLHDSGAFDDALKTGKALLKRHPDHPGLLAAVSVLAIDMEDPELARTCATRAGNQPDALTTLGTLTLGEGRNAEAYELFTQALQQNSQLPRAWIGKGLAELAAGASDQAAIDIRRGAEMFGSHIGSWIAAGWAELLANDLGRARECFEKALALDHNFSESHGSLAVINVIQGKADEARRQTQTALKLDRQSFSGALAQILLLQGQGKPDAARKLFERALHTPIDANGRTIAQSLARYGLSI